MVGKFEDDLKSFYRVSHVFAVSSGKAALVLILQALRDLHPEQDEVLIPAYTCYSVPSAIVRAGLRVRLCDMAPGTLDFDFVRIAEELENPCLLCVIPTHLFGAPADVERVKALASRRGIPVVEDAAQAMGGGRHGKKSGTLGDVGLFSLGRGKAFSTVEGGIILTDNDLIGRALEKRLAALAGYGFFDCLRLIVHAVALSVLINPRIYWLPKLLPFLKLGETRFDPSFPIRRLSSCQAGMAKKWQQTLARFRAARLANANRFAGYGIKPPGIPPGIFSDLIRFPVLAADAAAKHSLLGKSELAGLGLADGYPDSIDGIKELRNFFAGKTFPVAKDIAERIVTLPLHPYVNEDDVRTISLLFG
jgi:dTDP-4-amino-4,6-dideoxygalactose transaminase